MQAKISGLKGRKISCFRSDLPPLSGLESLFATFPRACATGLQTFARFAGSDIAVGTASCPAAPRTDPGVRFSRTGLFEDIRFRRNAITAAVVVSASDVEESLVASARTSPADYLTFATTYHVVDFSDSTTGAAI